MPIPRKWPRPRNRRPLTERNNEGLALPVGRVGARAGDECVWPVAAGATGTAEHVVVESVLGSAEAAVTLLGSMGQSAAAAPAGAREWKSPVVDHESGAARRCAG